jgi:hypothetical protein
VPVTSKSSGLVYPAGLYLLSDGVAGDSSVTTWQWYLIRNKEQFNTANHEVEPYLLKSPTLLDGDQIIWRLVVVSVGPIRTLPAGKTTEPGRVSAYTNKKMRLSKT